MVESRPNCINAPRRVRLNTDGLANLVYGRDVTPDLEGPVDALSISPECVQRHYADGESPC